MYIQVILYVAIALAGVFLFSKRRPKKGKIIPGPTGLPIIGYAHKIKTQTAHELFSDLAKKYGDIFQIKSVGETVIVLNSNDTVRSFFCDEPYKRFGNDRPKLFWSDKVSYDYKGVFPVIRAFNSPLAQRRKYFVRGMNAYGDGVAAFENTVQTQLKKLTEQIESLQDKEFAIHPLIENFLHNVMSIFFSGEPIKDEYMHQVIREVNRGTDILQNPVSNLILSVIPVLRFLPPFKQIFVNTIRTRDALVQRYFHDAKKTYQPGRIRGLVDFYLNEQRLTNDENVSDEQVCAIVVEMQYAGIETTFSHLSSFFLCLMNYPEYQTKMQEEIDRVIGRDRLPALSDKHNCPFIEAVTLEVHRFITTVPLAGPHACRENIEFKGYDIPENSVILPNLWLIHHDEKVWGDPWTFRPERWLDDDGSLLPNDHVLRKKLLAFGTGRRQCIAESLARSRAFLFVATMLQRWTFEMPPGHVVSCDPRDGGMHFELVCCPKPYLCRAVPRKTHVL